MSNNHIVYLFCNISFILTEVSFQMLLYSFAPIFPHLMAEYQEYNQQDTADGRSHIDYE